MKQNAIALIVAGFCAAAMVAPARAQLVQNGDFAATVGGGGEIGYNTTVTDWTSTGYNFLFTSGSADTTGETGSYGNLKLWGPGDGSNNGLPASSPVGGNYIGADGAFSVSPIQQTVNDLVVGKTYTLGFWWAGAQQYGYTSPTTEQWQVSLGNDTQKTAIAHDASEGFTGWRYQELDFTATSASEVLSFLAIGTPDGEPPFSLLGGVTLNNVPEPGDLAVLAVGLIAIGGLVRRARQNGGARS